MNSAVNFGRIPPVLGWEREAGSRLSSGGRGDGKWHIKSHCPTQAKERLEWGTQPLLPEKTRSASWEQRTLIRSLCCWKRLLGELGATIAVKYFARGPVTRVSSMGHLMGKEIDNG